LRRGLLNEGARAFAHVGSDRAVPIDDDDPRLGLVAKVPTKPRGHLRRRLDAGEPAACNNDRVAPVLCRPIGQTVQMPVEGDRISELVNAETMLGEAGDIWTKQPAAGRHNHPIVGKTLLGALGPDDLHRPGFGVDRLCAALAIYLNNSQAVSLGFCGGAC
jgi:hypothetical protein